jgi:hypothetical protein
MQQVVQIGYTMREISEEILQEDPLPKCPRGTSMYLHGHYTAGGIHKEGFFRRDSPVGIHIRRGTHQEGHMRWDITASNN